MIGTEDIRHALGIDEMDENQFFEIKEELESLLGALSAFLTEQDFPSRRAEIMEEITHILGNVDVRFVPFLMILLQNEVASAFQTCSDISSGGL